jgi:hypothetical protein
MTDRVNCAFKVFDQEPRTFELKSIATEFRGVVLELEDFMVRNCQLPPVLNVETNA